MAAFALPGGAEWWIIAGILILLFGGPLITGFVAGFFTGRESERSAGASSARPVPKALIDSSEMSLDESGDDVREPVVEESDTSVEGDSLND